MIKKSPHIKNGARHYFEILKMARNCLKNKKELSIALKVLTTNAYNATSQMVLFAALFDDDNEIRSKAVNVIYEARKDEEKTKKLRKYELPKDYINFKASSYFKLLDFDTLDKKYIESPPIIRNIPNHVLFKCAKGEVNLNVPNLPCHNTDIERSVQRTAQAAKAAIGYEKRQALILTMEENVAQIPTEAKNADFT